MDELTPEQRANILKLDEPNNVVQDNLKDEKKVNTIGDTILFLGLITSVIFIIVGFAQYEEHYSYPDDPINWTLVIVGIIQSLTSLAIWSILRMLSNISTTLKK